MKTFLESFGIDAGSFLAQIYFQNTVEALLTALLVFVVLFLILKIFRGVVLTKLGTWAQKSQNTMDDKLVAFVSDIAPIFSWYMSLYMASQVLVLHSMISSLLDAVLIILIVLEANKVALNFVDFFFLKATKRKDETVIAGIRIIAKIALWSVAILLILSNLGINVSAIVASMGIGGIAVALAAQNVLGDLFASFTIYFDKPFQIGDYVTVGTDSGTVKKIGLKTTRIQTLQGEELIISNKELTEARVQNFKKLKKRRTRFAFGVTYDTKGTVLKKIPDMVLKIINAQDLCEADRVVFTDFGDFSLNFEVIFYCDSHDYGVFTQAQHDINIALKEKFDAEKIDMAFPTQTLYIQK